MEFDSIIYIVIAIVLAIINAVAQKKKKAAAGQQSSSSDNLENLFDPVDEGVDESYDVPDEKFSSDPLEVLFGKERQNYIESEVVEPEPKFVEEERTKQEKPEPVLSDFEHKLQAKAQEFMEFKHESNQYDFEEDSIASSAIGDALSADEEEAAFREGRSDFIKEFDPKKAIIYSEVIKPKYFSVGVNS